MGGRLAEWLRRRRLTRRSLDSLEPRVVWILGSPRTGSSWLMEMLREAPDPGITALDEPRIGELLVTLNPIMQPDSDYPQLVTISQMAAGNLGYVLAEQTRALWSPWLRGMLLEEFELWVNHEARGRAQRRRRLVLLKEPNSSHAADEIVKILPRSRVIFLMRDGRDVVDSSIDVLEEAKWGALAWAGHRALRGEERPGQVAAQASLWVFQTEAVQRACSILPPEQSIVVRYEDLRADTASELARITAWLGLELPAGWTAEVAEHHSFEALPDVMKGPGTRRRAAQPGLWRENLSAGEQRIAEEIMGPKLRELGYPP